MWLKDLLPEAVPQARVMSFGFEASFKNITARQELRTTAGYLLTELNDCRVTEEVNKILSSIFTILSQRLIRKSHVRSFSYVIV